MAEHGEGKIDKHEEMCGKSNDGPHREYSSARKCKNTYLCILFNEDQYGI
jgi:hypothetical protein